MLTFLVVLFVFSILIIVHELGHLFAAKCVGVKVEKFSLGFGKKIFGIKRKDTEYVISVFPFGGYVKLAGDNPAECKGAPDEFFSKNPLRRFFIIVAGSFTNYIFAFLLFIAIFMIGFPTLTTEVGKILSNYPAATSGLKEGDTIVEINKTKVEYWNDLVSIVEKQINAEPLDVTVERGKRLVKLEIVPKVIKGKNIFGQDISVGKIGIMPQNKIILVRHNILESVIMAGEKLLGFTAVTYKGLWLIITGGIPFKESVSGPIGIAVIIGQAAKAGMVSVLVTMAYINVALAIFNLLPIPVLDGGHVIFLMIEKLRGRPVSPRTQEIVSQVALYILIAIVVFASWNDINRFFPFFKK